MPDSNSYDLVIVGGGIAGGRASADAQPAPLPPDSRLEKRQPLTCLLRS